MLTLSTDIGVESGAILALARAGNSLLAAGRIEEAEQALELGVLLEDAGPSGVPGAGEVRFTLANLLHAQGRHAEAAAQYEALLLRQPEHTEAHYNLGVTELLRGRIGEAASSYRRVLQLDPSHANAHNNLALLLESFATEPEAHAEALAHFRASGSAEARYNLALLLHERGATNEAAAIYRSLLAEDGGHLEARNNLGNIALFEGRPADALAEYRRILALDPQFVEGHHNAAMAELFLGNFTQGFREYEWRFRRKPMRNSDPASKLWDGSDLAGQTILLQAEQGIGDTIQFLRFVPMVAAMGGNVILESQRPVAELAASVSGLTTVIPRGDALPPHDVHCPLMSLPYRLGVTLEDLPNAVPYLSAIPDRVANWRRRIRLISGEDELRVGLAWSGNPNYKDNARRSVPPGFFEVFSGLEGIRWFGLQKDQANVQIPGLHMEWLERSETTFSDAAAIVANLDLVISVDTSIAHLAGALARPVWLLTAHTPDWRWMLDREDSPWYPTMRLFRQPEHGAWRPVIERIRERLQALMRGGRTPDGLAAE
ncbi:MAG: tetratricopeptide repeat protein [Bryobacteraceae bacterium]